MRFCLIYSFFVFSALHFSDDSVASTDVKRLDLSLGAMTISADHRTIYVGGDAEIVSCDSRDLRIKKRLRVFGEVSGMVIHPDSGLLYVTIGGAVGEVLVIDGERLRVVDRISAGHTPMSPIFSETNDVLYVCNRFGDSITAYDLKTKQLKWESKVLREPMSIVLSKDGHQLYVSNHLTDKQSTAGKTGCSVSVLAAADGRLIKNVMLPDGSSGVKSLSLSEDGAYLYAPSVLARHRLPATQLAKGWVSTSAMHIIDTRKNEYYASILLDDIDRGGGESLGNQGKKQENLYLYYGYS